MGLVVEAFLCGLVGRPYHACAGTGIVEAGVFMSFVGITETLVYGGFSFGFGADWFWEAGFGWKI